MAFHSFLFPPHESEIRTRIVETQVDKQNHFATSSATTEEKTRFWQLKPIPSISKEFPSKRNPNESGETNFLTASVSVSTSVDVVLTPTRRSVVDESSFRPSSDRLSVRSSSSGSNLLTSDRSETEMVSMSRRSLGLTDARQTETKKGRMFRWKGRKEKKYHCR